MNRSFPRPTLAMLAGALIAASPLCADPPAVNTYWANMDAIATAVRAFL